MAGRGRNCLNVFPTGDAPALLAAGLVGLGLCVVFFATSTTPFRATGLLVVFALGLRVFFFAAGFAVRALADALALAGLGAAAFVAPMPVRFRFLEAVEIDDDRSLFRLSRWAARLLMTMTIGAALGTHACAHVNNRRP